MIDRNWRRIAAIHVQPDGSVGAVWVAHDKTSDVIHVYDCCVFRREVLAVVVEGLNARGRWIPIAWAKSAKKLADQLSERGCNMLIDGIDDDDATAELMTREIWERMRTGRFKVDKRLGEWAAEFKSYGRRDSKIPQDSFLLMTATRYACSRLTEARRRLSTIKKQSIYPKLAVV